MNAPTLFPPLRSAVIGCGAIAYEHLPFLAKSADTQVVGLCDRSKAMAGAAKMQFELDAPIFANTADMLNALKPDIVHVLSPPQTHDALVRQAIAAGAHVICEKPMTGTAKATAALLECAKAADRVLIESRNLLFNDPVIELLEIVRSGRLGEVRECDILLDLDFLAGPFGDLNLDGPGAALPAGAVHDFLPHLVYLFQMFTGIVTAERVMGELTNRSGNVRAGFDFLDVLLRSGEVRGRLRVATDVGPSAFRIVIRGTSATAETDLYNPFLRFEGPPDLGKRAPLGQVRNGAKLICAGFSNLRNKIGQHGTTHGISRMLEAVYSNMRKGQDLPITAPQMLATALLTDQIVGLKAAS